MIIKSNNTYTVNTDEEITKLVKGMFGKKTKNGIELHPIEVNFLREIRKFKVDDNIFLDILPYLKQYIVYRDLRMRGLKIRINEFKFEGTYKPIEIYKKTNIKLPNINIRGIRRDNMIVVFNKEAKQLYDKYWFGQWGMYKKSFGDSLILDIYEAKYLKEKGILKVNLNNKLGEKYNVYKNWRDAGFILKSGFKFGGDFRIYTKDVKPTNVKHSKHIIDVFEKEKQIKAEDWSKSVRIVHGVRKTYVLCMPYIKAGMNKPDFAVIGRNNTFSYYVKAFKANENISAKHLLGLLMFAQEKNSKLLISIVDRETSVLYYIAKRIILPDDKHIYFEIDWIQP